MLFTLGKAFITLELWSIFWLFSKPFEEGDNFEYYKILNINLLIYYD